MSGAWAKYRLIIFGIIIIAFFIARTVLPVFKTGKGNEITPLPGLNRNSNNLVITKHAACRMNCRDITEAEIKEILHEGNINYMKSDLYDSRGPSYAVEGYSHEHQHLRIVFAPKNDVLVVVTCIDLDKEWQCDCN